MRLRHEKTDHDHGLSFQDKYVYQEKPFKGNHSFKFFRAKNAIMFQADPDNVEFREINCSNLSKFLPRKTATKESFMEAFIVIGKYNCLNFTDVLSIYFLSPTYFPSASENTSFYIQMKEPFPHSAFLLMIPI